MSSHCIFATDLHGRDQLYRKLFSVIADELPSAIFLGGDLLPKVSVEQNDFVQDFLFPMLSQLKDTLGELYSPLLLILGNDDPGCVEALFLDAERQGLCFYLHGRNRTLLSRYKVYGYSCIPPTPFLLKDWERYDVSRYVDPGCVSPEDGHRTVAFAAHEIKWGTIQNDLSALVGAESLDRAIMLIHAPPYDTPLDRAALDGRTYEHVKVDVHVGSIAVQRFIEQRQPLLTLHGHVHESTRITGTWKMQIGKTICINGAHDGPELAIVRFDPDSPADASRQLL